MKITRLLASIFLIFTSTTMAADDVVSISKVPDFSGSWEKDYRRSDNWEEQLRSKINDLRRQAEQRARRGGESRPSLGQVNIGNPSRTNVIDLARFTELISRHTTMQIKQDQNQITIEREGEADLICSTSDKVIRSQNEFGAELCVWQKDRLIFKIQLNEGTVIYQRFLLSPNRQALNLLSRVSHPGSSSFELVQFFDRYEAPAERFKCSQTLSKGKVCSLRQAGTKAP